MLEGIDSRRHLLEGHREDNTCKVSLQDRLHNMAGQPFSLEETFTILGQLGQALCSAHQCNVTHGNLKPETIFFNEKGEVLLAEFFQHTLATQPKNDTAPEACAYRAPELLPGQASKLGDQYALGCIAYEMLTGNKPFLVAFVGEPDSFYRTKKAVPPKHFNPELSSQSEEAILKAIANEPGMRHREMSCFLTSLGIAVEVGDQATSMEDVQAPFVSGPPEPADLHQAPIWSAVEEAKTPLILGTSLPTQTVHPTETSIQAEAGEFSSDHYPAAYHAVTDAIPRAPEISRPTSAYAGPSGKNSATFFFKGRWIGIVITCLVAICIVVTSILTISASRLAQEHKAIPAIDTKINPSPTATFTSPTPTPEATPTPATIAPLPITVPTVTVQPTPTPKHGHH